MLQRDGLASNSVMLEAGGVLDCFDNPPFTFDSINGHFSIFIFLHSMLPVLSSNYHFRFTIARHLKFVFTIHFILELYSLYAALNAEIYIL
jgi:hypothetical protein